MLIIISVALIGKNIISMQGEQELNLSQAASGARLGKVKKLLSLGANPNEEYSTKYYLRTPLRAAAYNVGRFGDMPELEQKFIEIIKLLIQEGANVNQQDKNGWTALMVNVDKYESPDSLEVTKILLNAGADPLLKNYHGKSAFDLNNNYGQNTKTKALLEDAKLNS